MPTQFHSGWLVVMKMGRRLISSLSACFMSVGMGAPLQQKLPRANSSLVDDGFLKDDRRTVWELIKMKVRLVPLSGDSCGFGVRQQDVDEQRFSCVGGALQDETLNFGNVHRVDCKEFGEKVVDVDVVCAEECCEPRDVGFLHLGEGEVINHDLVEMFGFYGLETFDRLDLYEGLNDVFTPIAKLF